MEVKSSGAVCPNVVGKNLEKGNKTAMAKIHMDKTRTIRAGSSSFISSNFKIACLYKCSSRTSLTNYRVERLLFLILFIIANKYHK